MLGDLLDELMRFQVMMGKPWYNAVWSGFLKTSRNESVISSSG